MSKPADVSDLTLRMDSAAATVALGERMASGLQGGDFLAFEGDLGAGKTTFIQGLCRGLRVVEPVTSPTFVLLRIYRGRLPVYHFDAYRLDSVQELEEIGAEEYFWGSGVCMVEWSERIQSALPPHRLRIRMSVVDDTSRDLAFTAFGARHQQLLQIIAC